MPLEYGRYNYQINYAKAIKRTYLNFRGEEVIFTRFAINGDTRYKVTERVCVPRHRCYLQWLYFLRVQLFPNWIRSSTFHCMTKTVSGLNKEDFKAYLWNNILESENSSFRYAVYFEDLEEGLIICLIKECSIVISLTVWWYKSSPEKINW